MSRRRRRRGRGWAHARSALHSAVLARLGAEAEVEVGWVSKAGEGLYRDVFAAEVEGRSGSEEFQAKLVALIPRSDAPADQFERVVREPVLLAKLSSLDLKFGVPRWSTVVIESDRPVLVREYVRCIPLDLRAGQQPRVEPWQVVGEVAAAVHAIDVEEVRGLVPGFATRRAHAEACLEEASEVAGDPLADDALAWMRAHLPGDEPASFLHGDLLGQNILYNPLRPLEPPVLIDWEYSRIGDPAYDLAVVTRGARRPFQIKGGLGRLIEAYQEAGGASVRATEVHLHALCFACSWYRDALRGDHVEPPEQVLNQLRGMLRRSEKADAGEPPA